MAEDEMCDSCGEIIEGTKHRIFNEVFCGVCYDEIQSLGKEEAEDIDW